MAVRSEILTSRVRLPNLSHIKELAIDGRYLLRRSAPNSMKPLIDFVLGREDPVVTLARLEPLRAPKGLYVTPPNTGSTATTLEELAMAVNHVDRARVSRGWDPDARSSEDEAMTRLINTLARNLSRDPEGAMKAFRRVNPSKN